MSKKDEFAKIDANNDGVITKEEWNNYHNKAIYKKLNPSTNIAINITFCRYTNMKCFEMEGDYNKIHEIDLIDNCWKSNINWKLYLVQINKHFKEYPLHRLCLPHPFNLSSFHIPFNS